MTLTYPILNRARRVLWVVTGSEKVANGESLLDGDPSIPAGRVRRDKLWCWPIARRQGR